MELMGDIDLERKIRKKERNFKEFAHEIMGLAILKFVSQASMLEIKMRVDAAVLSTESTSIESGN
jgi:hypothetical protein